MATAQTAGYLALALLTDAEKAADIWFLVLSAVVGPTAPPLGAAMRTIWASLTTADELDWSRACVDGSHVRAKRGGAATRPSPVDRRKTGSKRHLICDGKGMPLHVITTAANVNDIAQTLNLVDGISPVAGRPGRLRRRPECVLGDKAYDAKAMRRELRRRRILPVISRKGAPNIKGLGKLRYLVEPTFALLQQFKRLAVRWERRPGLHKVTHSGCPQA
ncbi:IS5 family transposase [Streptomyces sp. OE57]|uniref:IS5 family transposase n=1 Tax=Streptomyces lacaronensis TaxID=3379885 RepID=UPI0039B77F06